MKFGMMVALCLASGTTLGFSALAFSGNMQGSVLLGAGVFSALYVLCRATSSQVE